MRIEIVGICRHGDDMAACPLPHPDSTPYVAPEETNMTAEQWKRIVLWGECRDCVLDAFGICPTCDERAVIADLDAASSDRRMHP